MKTSYLILIPIIFCGALIIGGCSGHDNTSNGNVVSPAPVNLTAIAGVRSLTVSWDSVPGATTYNLYYSTSSGVTSSTGTKVANISSPYTLTSLTSDTAYYVVVTSVKGNTESVASSQVFDTTHRISNVIGSQYSDYGSAITADKFGNLYAVGDTSGEFDGNTKTGLRDIFLIKYDVGGAKKWSRQIGAVSAYSNVTGVAVDNAGYIYVTGTTGGSFDGNIKTGSTDLFLIKYDSNGNKLWSRQIGAVGANIDRPSIAVDKTGFVFIAGSTDGSLAGKMITGVQDLFLVKYDKDGNLLWLQMRGVINQYTGATSLVIGKSGDVILAGGSCGGFEGTAATGICDLLLIKYDADGNKGWAQMVGAVGAYTNVQSVAVDSESNSYVTGFSGGNYDGITKPAWGDNMFLSKFDKNGVKLWSRLLSGGFYAYGNAVTVDNSGNAYITGNTGNPIDGNSAVGQMDLFLVKYDTDGNKKWSKQMGVTYSSTSANGITIDGIGGKTIYIVGSANGDIFTHVPSSSYYDFNFFLVGIDSNTGEY